MKKSLPLAALLAFASGAFADWPQAAGPHGTWQTTGTAPLKWSVARNENITWKTTLPETGQSGIAVANGRVFLTTMKPLPEGAKSKEGSDIVGYCLDAKDGKILWTVELPGTEKGPYAYGFSDSSTPSPITDGQRVWFYNASGSLGCYDFSGKELWKRTWKPTAAGRPFNKQFEPMMLGNAILNMEPRDENDPKREKDPWNYLRALDKNSGATLWVSDDALTHYNTPRLGTLPDGTPAVLQGRGGHHDVPERPEGLSLTSLKAGNEGKTLWRFENPSRMLYVMHWDKKHAYWLNESGEHRVLDAATGKLLRAQSLTEKADWRRYDEAAGDYVLQSDVNLKAQTPPINVMPAWFTNIVVGDWHYFLTFSDAGAKRGPAHCVGRVNVESGKVEYLELPTGVQREAGQPDKLIWGKAQSSSTVNSRGVDVAGDPRSRRDGWYWNFNGTPTAVDGKIFWTMMNGITYVIDGRAATLDKSALLSVNDLGPAGQTWSLNSISFSDGRLYHRSMKEVVCIGK